MCRKLVLLLIVLGVIAGFSSVASALPLIGAVDRSGGASGNRPPINPDYDGEEDPLPTQAGGWTVGNYMFSDRDFNWGAVAPQVNHAEQVRTYNSDKDNRSTVTYTVTFPIGATVLIAVDNRFTGQQGYVDSIVVRFAAGGTFTDTGWEVVSNEGTPRSFSVFSAVLGPGTYVFVGANAGSNNFYVIGALPLPTKARNPIPADDAMVDATTVALTWVAGDLAVQHDVYCSTSFDDVNDANSSDPMGSDKVYKARQSGTKYPPGLGSMPLTRGKTYYWRIDEVNDLHADKLWRGDIWSFEVVSSLNWNPSPPHQARFVPVTTDLSWSKGALAKEGHIIYLSTDFTDVNDAVPGTEGGPAWLGTTLLPGDTSIEIPGNLLKGTTYYWRADPVEQGPPFVEGA